MKRNVSKEVAGKIIKALNSNIMIFDKTVPTKAKDASVKRISGVRTELTLAILIMCVKIAARFFGEFGLMAW